MEEVWLERRPGDDDSIGPPGQISPRHLRDWLEEPLERRNGRRSSARRSAGGDRSALEVQRERQGDRRQRLRPHRWCMSAMTPICTGGAARRWRLTISVSPLPSPSPVRPPQTKPSKCPKIQQLRWFSKAREAINVSDVGKFYPMSAPTSTQRPVAVATKHWASRLYLSRLKNPLSRAAHSAPSIPSNISGLW